MKPTCVLLVCLLVSANADAHSVTLNWIQSDSLNIVSDKVSCGHVAGGPYPYSHTTKVPATTLKAPKVPSGKYYCVVTAIDDKGQESVASNEVEVVVP